MMSDLDLVRFACVAHHNHDLSESTILAEFNSADSSLQELAHQCIHRAPPHHSIFSHSFKNHTYTFLLDDPFIYFGIFDPKMAKSDQIGFLGKLKEALNSLIKLNRNHQYTSHCFQGELHPIFPRVMKKSFDHDPLHLVPNGVNNHSNHPVSGSVPPSSRAMKIFNVPVLSPTKLEKGFKKKMPSGESKEAFVNGKDEVLDADSVSVCEVKSRKVISQNGLYLNEAGGGGGRQKAKKIWRRHVWIVLALDLAVCLILFGIWLFVCRGFECIER